MRVEGTFSVTSTVPGEVVPPPEPIAVGIPVGTMTFTKEYAGDVTGRSASVFTSAYDISSGVGTYVAMETFESSLAGAAGSFAYVHSATTRGGGREKELFAIVPGRRPAPSPGSTAAWHGHRRGRDASGLVRLRAGLTVDVAQGSCGPTR